jgi:hypothetical protein
MRMGGAAAAAAPPEQRTMARRMHLVRGIAADPSAAAGNGGRGEPPSP